MARRPELRPLIDHLREQAQRRDDIRTECAGVIVGSPVLPDGWGLDSSVWVGSVCVGPHFPVRTPKTKARRVDAPESYPDRRNLVPGPSDSSNICPVV